MLLHRKILVALLLGAVLGTLANFAAPEARWLQILTDYVSEPVGQIFIRLLILLVVPIVFSALVIAIGELKLSEVGRLGAKSLAYTLLLSACAAAIGIGLVSFFEPGANVSQGLRESVRSNLPAPSSPERTSLASWLVNLVPSNPFRAAADGDMLGFSIFSLIFGLGLAQSKTEPAERVREFVQGIYDVVMRIVHGVLQLAPIGVAALLFTMTARTGFGVLQQIATYVLVVVLGFILHSAVVYSVCVRVVGGLSPVKFFRDIRLAIATAFSTASSAATLPTALDVADENLKLPRRVSRFVLTAGASMNQNGTALFEGVTVLFLAQAYGVALGFWQQALVMAISVLAGLGSTGVPAGSLPVITTILILFRIPPEGLALILGVDRLLDMCRTVVNVTGDLAVAVCVARGERSEELQTGLPELGSAPTLPRARAEHS